MHLDSKSLSALVEYYNDELAPKTGRAPVRAFRTKAEAIARIQKCLSELEQAPGFKRLKDRLGEEGAEVLRRQVLADQAVATALARRDTSTKGPEASEPSALECTDDWIDARSDALLTLSKRALLLAYNETFCGCLGRLPRKNVRSVESLRRKIQRALDKLDGRRVGISREGEVALD